MPIDNTIPLELRYEFGSFKVDPIPATGATSLATGATPPATGATPPATGATASGGADPVTAIANAVGKLFDFGRAILGNTQLNKKSWLERLNESVPVFHNWDAERIDKSKEYLYAIGFLGVVVTIVVLAIVYKDKK